MQRRLLDGARRAHRLQRRAHDALFHGAEVRCRLLEMRETWLEADDAPATDAVASIGVMVTWCLSSR